MKLIFDLSPDQLCQVSNALRKAYFIHFNSVDKSEEAMLDVICDDWIRDRDDNSKNVDSKNAVKYREAKESADKQGKD